MEKLHAPYNTPIFVKILTKKIIEIASHEIGTNESQLMIKRRIITPVINMIYTELYPYIIAMIVSILTILVLSMMTFIGFIFYFVRK
jgi:hypothetical protein